MLKSTYIFILLFIFSLGYGQFDDSFDQSTINSTWLGQTDDFIINSNNELQLNTTEAGTSLLYHPVTFSDSLIWDFDIRMALSPSANNNLQVLLAVDNADLTIANGYILNIGESGSDDAIHLIQLTNGIESTIATGTLGLVASSFKLNINLQKNSADQWILVSTDLNNSTVSQEFDVLFNENILENQMFFGFSCLYTASNSDNFYFDNINIESITSDLQAPGLLSFEIIDNQTIQLIFDEIITQASAENFSNYTFIPDNTLVDINFDASTGTEVQLTLLEPLSSCSDFVLTINGIQDLVGNTINETTQTISVFEQPQVGDILINELLSNPIGTGTDFVEIINVSSKSIQLKDFIISNTARDDESIINEVINLLPNEIVVISESLDNLMETYGTVSPIRHIQNDLPGFNNADGNVSLIINSTNGPLTIDSYNYDDNQLNPDLESIDGVSFERISCLASTNNFENWSSALESVNFATPGYENSISIPDNHYIDVTIINNTEIEVRFKDAINEDAMSNLSNYAINNINISDILIKDDNPKVAIVFFENALMSGTEYSLAVNNITTVCGTFLPEDIINLRLIESAEIGDLLINEILFNPYKDQFDFVEIINVSNKFIRLDNLNILNSHSGNDADVMSSIILNPDQIIAFTESPQVVIDQYVPPTEATIIFQDLPGFNDNEGNVTLRQEAIIGYLDLDAFDYNEDYHFELIRDNEGISLERISLITATNEPENWFSSSEGNNFATPGYENSTRIDPTTIEENVSLSYKTFSPNGDSDKDILFINYNLNKLGFVGNIKVYDDKGRPKKSLANNVALGAEGFFRWDGIKDDGMLAPIGMYIIQYEFFHPDGDIVQGKKVCILAQNLN